eukprot:COSAG04_NODE_4724_length_1924_cov_1.395616_1_plen_90_part_00
MKRKCPEKSSVMNGLRPDERPDEAATGGDGRTQFAANPVVGVVPVVMAKQPDPRPADGVEARASGSGGGGRAMPTPRLRSTTLTAMLGS